MPTVEGDPDVATTPEFLTAILEASKSRAEKKHLLLVEKKIHADQIAKAGKEEKVALLQEEEARLQALLSEARMMEEEADRGLKEGTIAKNNVVASWNDQHGFGRVNLLAPAPALDKAIDDLFANRRRSDRAQHLLPMDGDEVERRDKAAIRESKKEASAATVNAGSKKRERTASNAKRRGAKKAKVRSAPQKKRKLSEKNLLVVEIPREKKLINFKIS
jgi:hypothetical protein